VIFSLDVVEDGKFIGRSWFIGKPEIINISTSWGSIIAHPIASMAATKSRRLGVDIRRLVVICPRSTKDL